MLAHAQARIESEYKLAVPEEEVSTLWSYLETQFTGESLKEMGPQLEGSKAEEIFIDTYFDDDQNSLVNQQAGLRFRQRFSKDSLIKELVQLKLPSIDQTGVARQEIKFDRYTNPKKKDRLAEHSFWQYIKPKNRDKLKRHLAQVNADDNSLQANVKVKQVRNRVYIKEDQEALMTFTLDQVNSFYFPYPTFVELELELNEVRYTQAAADERQRMEAINDQVKAKILQAFPNLKQDQTPKYNKMKQLIDGNWLAQIYNHLMYWILAAFVGFTTYLFFMDQKKKANAN